ncbi:MAG: hypothetical protein M3380_04870 [Chloroflexota bacterium]|nr:hypothetical protein [Chloroflexota bacterium]
MTLAGTMVPGRSADTRQQAAAAGAGDHAEDRPQRELVVHGVRVQIVQ